MDFQQTDEQQMLAEQANRLLEERAHPDHLRALIDKKAQWDEELWRELAAMGFLGAAIPEEYGGLGMGRADLAVLSEALGRKAGAVPFFSSCVMAAEAILLSGSEEQKSRWLPAIASGEIVATLAAAEEGGDWHSARDVRLKGGLLSGTKAPVADAGIADLLVVSALGENGPTLALVRTDAPGVRSEQLSSFDELRAHFRVRFEDTPAETLAAISSPDLLSTIFDRAAIQSAFEAVGGAAACIEMARDYAMERQIFGRPLAGYQAIKHKLADLKMKVELARSAAAYGAWVADNDSAMLPAAAAAARLTAISAYEAAARENLQVHGGIGYTFEANCHFHYRRERTLSLSLGGRQYWADRLVEYGKGGAEPEAIDASVQDSEDEARFRKNAATWLAGNAPEFSFAKGEKVDDSRHAEVARAWQARLHEGGYSGLLLPKDIGGQGRSLVEALIFQEEESRYNVPRGPFTKIGLNMALPVIIKHGSDEQRAQHIEPTLTGERTWCQLFSEPGAGSDLASLRTKAVREGDEWIVNGQKVWSSWAHLTDWAILIARTDPTVPKHKGLTFFLLDMKSKGVETRPIRQISGEHDFNETFLTDVRIPDENRVGAPGEGWACAMTVLMGERLGSGGSDGDGGIARLIDLAAGIARGNGTLMEDPYIRARLGEYLAEEHAEAQFQAKLRSMVTNGENPGALASIVKLASASRMQSSSGFAMEMQGPHGIAHGSSDTENDRIWHDYIWSTALRVAGGADEVLRNQIAERVLGMPGEIRADKDVPFEKLK
jgi:acyl-CoA dehydrogenase